MTNERPPHWQCYTVELLHERRKLISQTVYLTHEVKAHSAEEAASIARTIEVDYELEALDEENCDWLTVEDQPLIVTNNPNHCVVTKVEDAA